MGAAPVQTNREETSMTVFRVGQRVRKVRRRTGPVINPTIYDSTSPSVPIGSEGTVVNASPFDEGMWIVLFDTCRSSHPEGSYSMHGYALEPIQPEGNKVIAWSECLWQPSHLRETA